VDLTTWVHAQGIDVRTAYGWCRKERLPVPGRKVGRLVLVSPRTAMEAAGKTGGAGLDGQVVWLSAWAAIAGRVEAGVGSGVDGLRVKVRGLLPARGVTVVLAGHRDGRGWVNTALAGLPCLCTTAAWWCPATPELTAAW
jgi:predicted site-specific integrase-resolvase